MKLIQQYNVRRVGSTWARDLLNRQLGSDIMVTDDEKHGMPIRKEEVDGYLIMTRNPYAYLNSMKNRMPETLHEDSHPDAWRILIEDYVKSHKLLLQFKKRQIVPVLFTRWENWYENPDKFVDHVAKVFNIESDVINTIDIDPFDRIDYYKYGYYIDDLQQTVPLQNIRSWLNYKTAKPIINQIGYDTDWQSYQSNNGI